MARRVSSWVATRISRDSIRRITSKARRSPSDRHSPRQRNPCKGFSADQVIGIGVDTTGSTPLPVNAKGQPLAFERRFAKNPAAMAWLWKDHTGVAEAAEITALAKKIRPQFLAKCGGIYSSEWFWSKILHCLRAAPEVFNAAHSWIELADYVPAALTGTEHPDQFIAGVCAAGHKAMWNTKWGGYPDAQFLVQLDPKLGKLRSRLTPRVHSIDRAVGRLTAAWAKKTGLRAGIPVAVGAFDAHLGAVGCGIAPGTLVKIIGTSTCDITIAPNRKKLADVPGLCGIVDGSVLPGYFGLEAGQSAVGDIFNWFVNYLQPGGKAGTHEALTAGAAKLKPGESGLLALDWNNGNRTILVDQRLTGLLAGQTLYTTPAEIYRALVRSHGIRRADHHQSLRGIRREDRAGRQLRRHRGKKSGRDADLCGRNGPPDENFALGADVCARLGHRGRRRRGRAQKLRRRAESDDRPEIQSLQAGCQGARGLLGVVSALPEIA